MKKKVFKLQQQIFYALLLTNALSLEFTAFACVVLYEE